jgi:hypothetical protein
MSDQQILQQCETHYAQYLFGEKIAKSRKVYMYQYQHDQALYYEN